MKCDLEVLTEAYLAFCGILLLAGDSAVFHTLIAIIMLQEGFELIVIVKLELRYVGIKFRISQFP